MSHKIFDNDLVTIRKSKVTLTFNKPIYVRICIIILKINMLLTTQDYYSLIQRFNIRN